MTGVNPVPFRAAGVEARLCGRPLDEAAITGALAEIEELDPMEDLHASADYRRALVPVDARRALESARSRAAA